MKDVTETLVADAEVDVVDGTVARAQQLLNEFNDLLSNARIQLMFKEVTLHDQIEVCTHYITFTFNGKYR